MLTVRRGLLAALFACSMFALASPAAAAPITLTQTVTADPVLPYLTFTNVTLTPGGWTGGAFPFTQLIAKRPAWRWPRRALSVAKRIELTGSAG